MGMKKDPLSGWNSLRDCFSAQRDIFLRSEVLLQIYYQEVDRQIDDLLHLL